MLLPYQFSEFVALSGSIGGRLYIYGPRGNNAAWARYLPKVSAVERRSSPIREAIRHTHGNLIGWPIVLIVLRISNKLKMTSQGGIQLAKDYKM